MNACSRVPQMRSLLFATILVLPACHSLTRGSAVPGPYEIGDFQRTVTTVSPDAKTWCERGLALTYGFNHEEAIKCYERAAELDPTCAMARWGKAYALGPNYNSPILTDDVSRAAYEELQAALELADGASPGGISPVERALIHALRARYARPEPEDRSALDAAYAREMRAVHAAFPDDADVTALTAEALMQVRPWKLWSADGVPAPETAEIRRVLERGLERWPNHPALCHLYIHAMEASPEVEKAIPVARRLENSMPGLGHLVHMPSHIYTWTGHYDDVVRVNQAAVAVDDKYVEHAGRVNIYTMYRVHNYHFIAYGGMFEGRRELALEAARKLTREIPPELHAMVPDLTDIFMATPYHVLVRFGRWDEILREPQPSSDLPAAFAVWRYARGIALASLGRVDEAGAEYERFLLAKDAVPETRLLFQNKVSDVLNVAERVLRGELEYRRGNRDAAFAALREAVVLDGKLNYDEPWGWMEPARHALGALLTDSGRYDEAVQVYRSDLRQYPENGWALNGLAECLEALGQKTEAAQVRARFAKAWARADTPIPGSCFCRIRPELARS